MISGKVWPVTTEWYKACSMPILRYVPASANVALMLLRKRPGSSRVDCHSCAMCIWTCLIYLSRFWSVVVLDASRDRFSGEERIKVRSIGTR